MLCCLDADHFHYLCLFFLTNKYKHVTEGGNDGPDSIRVVNCLIMNPGKEKRLIETNTEESLTWRVLLWTLHPVTDGMQPYADIHSHVMSI